MLHAEPRLRVAPPCKVLVSQHVRPWAVGLNNRAPPNESLAPAPPAAGASFWCRAATTSRQGASDRGQPAPAHGVGLVGERWPSTGWLWSVSKPARRAQHVTHGSPRVGGVGAVLGFHAQITHESVKAVLVAVVLFPAGKVSDVASPRGPAAQPPSQYWNGRSRTGFSREDHVCLRQSVCRPDMATCSWRS